MTFEAEALSSIGYLRIFALGERFDVNAYLEVHGALTPSRVWRRGEQDARPEHTHPKSSGLDVDLFDGPPPPLPEQQRIASAYLSEHRDELAALVAFPGVETVILALHYRLRLDLDPNVFAFSMTPHRRLSRLALDLKIDPTFYVWLDR